MLDMANLTINEMTYSEDPNWSTCAAIYFFKKFRPTKPY